MDVVAAILIQKNKVLLTRRPLHKKHGGLWEFPGGKVNPGESRKQALSRELQEELKTDLVWSQTIPLGCLTDDSLSIHFFAGPLASPYLPQEHSATSWSTLGMALSKKLCHLDHQACLSFQELIEGHITQLPSND